MSQVKSSDFFFVNWCVFETLPGEGSGRVWRQQEVPVFPPEPSPTHPTRCRQHISLQKSHLILFGSSLMDITEHKKGHDKSHYIWIRQILFSQLYICVGNRLRPNESTNEEQSLAINIRR